MHVYLYCKNIHHDSLPTQHIHHRTSDSGDSKSSYTFSLVPKPKGSQASLKTTQNPPSNKSSSGLWSRNNISVYFPPLRVKSSIKWVYSLSIKVFIILTFSGNLGNALNNIIIKNLNHYTITARLNKCK